MNADAKENFVGVNVSDASNQLLVEQNCFHSATMFSEDLFELPDIDIERIRRWLKENRDVHIYFDNDAEGAAPRNALTLLEMLR